MRIGRDRVRGSGGVTLTGRHVIGREQLYQPAILCIDDTGRSRAFRRGGRERPLRTAATGGVVVTVAGVEPDLVAGADPEQGRVDVPGLRVDNHVTRSGRDGAVRVPDVALRVEHLVAADKKVLTQSEGETGRAAE